MTTQLLPDPIFRGFDNSGNPLAGGQLFTYQAGTTTPQASFTDSTGSVPNTNPVVLNSRGEANVWLNPLQAYKVVLQDSLGNQIWAVDQVQTLINASQIGQTLYPQTANELAASVTPTNYAFAPGDVRRYGAVGDGVTPDTTACQNALTVNQNVTFPNGFTFLTSPLTESNPGVLVSGYGATLKQIAGSNNAALRVMPGANGTQVLGLTIDSNSTGNQGIVFYANDVEIRDCVFKNFGVAAIYGTQSLANNANRAKIFRNTITGPAVSTVMYGIYMDCLIANADSSKIVHNYVDMSANNKGNCIYITGSNDPFTIKQTKTLIQGNRCVGTAASSGPSAAITLRGLNGIVSENRCTGCDLGISGDISTQCTFSNNVIDGVNGVDAISLEVNGNNNSIVGNVLLGGRIGFEASVNGGTQPNGSVLDSNTITGNTIQDPSVYGIYFAVTGPNKTGDGNVIASNSIRFTTVATNRVAINLAGSSNGSVTKTLIQGNNLFGPGSGQSGGRGVRLDTVGNDVAILGNRFQGFERPVEITAATSLTFTDISVLGNDMTFDCPSATLCFVATGAGPAAFGSGCTFRGNALNSGQIYDVLLYGAAAPSQIMATTNGTPNGNLTAGPGSLALNFVGGAGTTLFVHESGSVNTTWVGK